MMIGDSVYDVIAASAAGLPTIGLLTGGISRAELDEVGAEHVYEDLPELIAAIDSTPLTSRGSG